MKKNLIALWGDLVDLKDLVIAIVICSVTTMGSFFLAPAQNTTKQLFFGLGGAVLGFIISTFLIKPKRNVIMEDDD
ncbi:hypothetical protein [Enterococcus caccae]|uniref:Uncharacterized protein n=1 Tax=Enterococcus caccae ATCC BAA-1240 TaxID=1158612 RepID=R3U1G3_9ENTE|nr:hypothetical protein [Enterococcus caccae]EOL47729.1 hypothetical protein UC7_00979 [Enterococcus caccae ATCC BAA-1240]EOT65527.1 hypothetical protein I580_01283 [Enterococcus caccae ATCC BAA-1240]OJG27291.1 hypothetical protein RU98_GL002743 [Enterococcus caccae]